MRQLVLAVVCWTVLLGGCGTDPAITRQEYMARGNQYFSQGKYRQAALLYQKIIQADSKSVEAYYRLGLAQKRLGRTRQAMSALQRANSLAPDHAGVFKNLAGLYLTLYRSNPKRRNKVLGRLQELLETSESYEPLIAVCLRIKGQLALEQKKFDEAVTLLSEAEGIQGSGPDLQFSLVRALTGAGRFEEAEPLALAAIQKYPLFAKTYDFLYWSYFLRQRYQDAEQTLLRKCEAAPKRFSYRMQLALHYRITRQPDKMKAVLDEVLKLGQGKPAVYARVGDFYRRFGDSPRALEAFQKAADLLPEPSPAIEKQIAKIYASEGRMDRVREIAGQILKQKSDDPDALAIRGVLRKPSDGAEQLAASIQDFQKSLELAPRNPAVRLVLGRAYLREGDVKRATYQFQRAAKLDPEAIPPRYHLALVRYRTGDYNGALRDVNRILRRSPRHLSARVLRARIHFAMKNHELARQEMVRTLKSHPDLRPAELLLARWEFTDADYEAAEKRFAELAARNPKDVRAVIGQARSLQELRRFSEAENLLRQRTRDSANPDPDLRLILADVLLAQNRVAEAITEYDTLAGQYPGVAVVQLRLGQAFRKAGQYEEAKRHLERLIEIKPSSGGGLSELAVVEEALGHRDEAIRYGEKALTAAPDRPAVMIQLARLLAGGSHGDLGRALDIAQRARRIAPESPDVADALAWVFIRDGMVASAIPILEEWTRKEPDNPRWHHHLSLALQEAGKLSRSEEEMALARRFDPSLGSGSGMDAWFKSQTAGEN